MPARRGRRSSVILRREVQNHNYTFIELRLGNSTRRGIRVIVRDVGARNNDCSYYLGDEYDPHALDGNWYLNHTEEFYEGLGLAIAELLENDPNQQWDARINWMRGIRTRIHRQEYVAWRQN